MIGGNQYERRKTTYARDATYATYATNGSPTCSTWNASNGCTTCSSWNASYGCTTCSSWNA
jgi:hypothetical protein